MATTEPGQALLAFGFTALESEVYANLLATGPATGYRVAQAIAKPAANTYKALQSLERKGAVLSDESDARKVRAVPAEELLARLAREFEVQRAAALESLQSLGAAGADHRVYTLRSAALVTDRARQMVQSAQRQILGALGPQALEALHEDLAAAVGRGVDVALKASVAEAPFEAYPSHGRDLAAARGDGQLRLAVDGAQAISALMGPDGRLEHALFSHNPAFFLALAEGLSQEISRAALAEKVDEGAGPKRLARALAVYRPID